jgi:hypothetical protein
VVGVTVLPCSHWRDIMAMRAIGQARPEESLELDRHLETCEQCRLDAAEVAGAAAALSVLSPAQVDRLERELPELSEPALYGPAPAASSWRSPFRSASTGAGTGTAEAGSDGRPGLGRSRRLLAGVGVAVVGVAAAAIAVVTLSGGPPTPEKTVALAGEHGVVATVALTAQASGTHATLWESGQPAGQVLTVSMKTASGRWWVAGSYRTTSGAGPTVVQLSCAVHPNQVTEVWVSDQKGRTVLTGYTG